MFRFVKKSIFVFIGLLGSLPAWAQVSHRLDQGWEFLREDVGNVWESVRPAPSGSSEAVPVWRRVTLPHCYNAEDAVDPDVSYYQGPAWYRTRIQVENPYQNGHTVLHFEGVGQKAEVYVYMTKVGEHIGGYDEWGVDITEAVRQFLQDDTLREQFQGAVPIEVRVDNSRDTEQIPSDLSDFTLYGGIYRPVSLRYLPNLSIEQLFIKPEVLGQGKSAKVSIRGRLSDYSSIGEAELEASLLDPTGRQVAVLQRKIADFSTEALWGAFELKSPILWSPEHPALYELQVKLRRGTETFVQTEKIGFRSFQFVDKGPFLLNDKRLLLRGTHRHEDHAGVGAAMTDSMILQEMGMMKDMGVNFIRLGHYQQSKAVLQACDSLGILVWEEIPWCRGGLGGDRYKEQARRMLKHMIEQHYNHPAIIIWGLGNENDWAGDFPEFDKERIRNFMKELNDLAHRLDGSRKTAIRRCDFCKDIVDVYSPSIWAGWYRGLFTDYRKSVEAEMQQVDHFLHVEWGGDSHARRHAENPDKVLSEVAGGRGTDERAGDASLFGGAARVSKDGDWSETYLCNLIDWHLKEQEKMPWLTGSAYWPFKDFATPVRPDNPVPYVNQKGVVERNLTKKESYYVFQSYWTKIPMIHLYGHSWPVRWGDAQEEKMVKVYSNCEEVELFVNGQSMGKKKRNSQDFPAAGLRWQVRFQEGANTLRAVGKQGKITVSDEIHQQYQTGSWGPPAKLTLEKVGQTDSILTIQATLRDAHDLLCLDAKNLMEFSITGDGKLLDNQGTSDGSRKVQLYNGRALIRIQMQGPRAVASVKSTGLPTAYVTLDQSTR